jgi:eukaryotic-like serine/threonine-protein kinase
MNRSKLDVSRDGIVELAKRFGQYEIIELITQAATANVYKARNLETDGLVALRVCSSSEINNELLKRWRREQQILARLHHPNIITVYDVGKIDGRAYLTMELLDGEPLSSVIAKGATLSLLQKIGIISQICETLQYLHKQGVVHRDVKPANIILLRDGKVKLDGFMIAWSEPDAISSNGAVMGTINYMSPEQLNAESVDGRTDIFSLGSTMYEVIEGKLPFATAKMTETILAILSDKVGVPESLKAKELRLPELQDVFDKALAKRREARYGSCAEFGEDLVRLKKILAARGES